MDGSLLTTVYLRRPRGQLQDGPDVKRASFYSTLALAVSLCGCVTVEVIPPEHLSDQQLTGETVPVAHIRAENWGWYLLNYIPLITGNVEHKWFPSFFSNTVRLKPLVEEVTRRSRELGATITELQSTDKSGWRAITLILWIREFEISANASKPLPTDPP